MEEEKLTDAELQAIQSEKDNLTRGKTPISELDNVDYVCAPRSWENTIIYIGVETKPPIYIRKLVDSQMLPESTLIMTPGQRVFLFGGRKGNHFFDTSIEILIKNDSKDIYIYIYIDECTSKLCTNMSEQKIKFGVCANLTHIYIIGGYSNLNYSSECERFSPHLGTWDPIPNLSEPKMACACCIVENKYIYTFGGNTNHDLEYLGDMLFSTKIERLAINTQNIPNWEVLFIPDISIYKGSAGSGAVQITDNYILIFGGMCHRDSFLFDFEGFFYNFKTGTFDTDISDLFYPDGFAAAYMINKAIYAFSNNPFTQNSSLFKYSVAGNQWTVKDT